VSSRILLIEDEPGLVLTITDLLEGEGYEVESAQDGEAGLARALDCQRDKRFDLVVLDVMLPRKNGFDVCREMRQKGIDAAIIMLTARGQVVDRVIGLKLGADDYVTKPFDPAELLARIEALLRRVRKENLIPVETFSFGDVQVDFRRSEVLRNGKPVSLAAKELQLLGYLIANRERVIPREEIMQKVWEYATDASSRTIDTHVAWLRQKLEMNPQTPRHIQTIRGRGYRFTS
jgi:two-component system, OmpR family, alkaline phosphatase synthesis response regulator PhoP